MSIYGFNHLSVKDLKEQLKIIERRGAEMCDQECDPDYDDLFCLSSIVEELKKELNKRGE
jgi:hypothetical protein